MNEFQSNSFISPSTNIQFPFYLYPDPFMEPKGESLRLWVYSEPGNLFAVTTYTDHDICLLKQKIAPELRNFSTGEMLLWKINTPISVSRRTRNERNAFARNIAAIHLPSLDSDDAYNEDGGVQLLDEAQKVSSYWTEGPEKMQLHILLQLPSPERPPKRQKLDREGEGKIVPKDMQMLWNQTWNRKEEAVPWFILKKTERDNTSTEVVPEYCWVLSPPDDIAVTLGLKPSTVLFRDDYMRAFSTLFASSGLGDFACNLDCNPGAKFPNIFSGVQVPQQTPNNAFILTGNAGIGKSIWLRILLVLRLSARLPTFYSSSDASIFLFTSEGAVEIPSKSLDLRFTLREAHAAWALFDSTDSLTGPPQAFLDEGLFVVHTPSPCSHRLEWRKKVPPTKLCCLALWSPAELICALSFQTLRHEEQALVKFCDSYGFSARDAYGNASDIDAFEANLEDSCRDLKYDKIVKIITDVQKLDFRNNISHTVLCISPAEVALKYTFDFTSRHVYKHILKSLRTSQVRAASMLYRLFLSMGKTRSTAGHMLEPAAHEILGDGGTFEVILLESSFARKLFHWKTPEDLSENVTARLHITSSGISLDDDNKVFGGQPPMLELPKGGPLSGFAFYYPSSQSQAMYDFLLYDPKDKHAWIFQVTTSPSHSVKAKCIIDLIKRGVKKISYTAITFAEATIDLPFSEDLNNVVVHKYQLRLR